jgi:hypothetical protein
MHGTYNIKNSQCLVITISEVALNFINEMSDTIAVQLGERVNRSCHVRFKQLTASEQLWLEPPSPVPFSSLSC